MKWLVDTPPSDWLAGAWGPGEPPPPPLCRREPCLTPHSAFPPKSHQAEQSHNMFLFFRPARTQLKGILKIHQACFGGAPRRPWPPEVTTGLVARPPRRSGPPPAPRGCWWQPHAGGHGRGCRAQGKTRAWTGLLQTAVTGQGRGDLQGSTPRTKVPRTAPGSVLSPWVLPGPSRIETLRSYIKPKSQSRGFQVKTKLQPFLGAWVWAKSHKTSLRFGFLICKMGKGRGAGARTQSVAPRGAGHAATNGQFLAGMLPGWVGGRPAPGWHGGDGGDVRLRGPALPAPAPGCGARRRPQGPQGRARAPFLRSPGWGGFSKALNTQAFLPS